MERYILCVFAACLGIILAQLPIISDKNVKIISILSWVVALTYLIGGK
jgi:hypothetical protein